MICLKKNKRKKDLLFSSNSLFLISRDNSVIRSAIVFSPSISLSLVLTLTVLFFSSESPTTKI
jgi:hypothetical protein